MNKKKVQKLLAAQATSVSFYITLEEGNPHNPLFTSKGMKTYTIILI